jgi:hypothetical protein
VWELDLEHRWLTTSVHVDVLNLFFHSLVKNVFDVLLALLVGPVVLEFIRLRSDPDVHL